MTGRAIDPSVIRARASKRLAASTCVSCFGACRDSEPGPNQPSSLPSSKLLGRAESSKLRWPPSSRWSFCAPSVSPPLARSYVATYRKGSEQRMKASIGIRPCRLACMGSFENESTRGGAEARGVPQTSVGPALGLPGGSSALGPAPSSLRSKDPAVLAGARQPYGAARSGSRENQDGGRDVRTAHGPHGAQLPPPSSRQQAWYGTGWSGT